MLKSVCCTDDAHGGGVQWHLACRLSSACQHAARAINAWTATIVQRSPDSVHRAQSLSLATAGPLRMASTLMCFIVFCHWRSMPWLLAGLVADAARAARTRSCWVFLRWQGIGNKVRTSGLVT